MPTVPDLYDLKRQPQREPVDFMGSLGKAKRPDIRCQNCNHLIFDGSVIKSRIVRVLERGSEVKCSGCKAWVRVPLIYC